MFDIHHILAELAKERPIFESEVEFQHELAYWIRSNMSGLLLHFEAKAYPEPYHKQRLDLAIPEIRVGIELKYSPKDTEETWQDRRYTLIQADDSAQRYDFVKDIERLECLCGEPEWERAFAIMLANDQKLWNPSRKKNPPPKDHAFRLDEGRELRGTLDWAFDSKRRDRRIPLHLQHRYRPAWKNYGNLGFKCLIVAVR